MKAAYFVGINEGSVLIYLQAMCIGNVLRDTAKSENGLELIAKDPLFLRGKADIGMFSLFLPSLLSHPSIILAKPVQLPFHKKTCNKKLTHHSPKQPK